jgi:hypothetical protein
MTTVIDVKRYPTIGAAFFEAATRYAEHFSLALPVSESRR